VTAPALVSFGNFTIDDVVLPDGTERPGCTGGDALYATLAARALAPTAELVAPVGHDFPAAIRASIMARGLSDAGMAARDRPTLHNRVEYFAGGDRRWTLFATEEEFDILSPLPADLPANWRDAPGFLVLAMTLAAQERLVADLATRGRPVALDPQEDYIAGNEDRLMRLIGQVDLFLPSAEEVRRLMGTDDWATAARQLAALGPRVVVIKLGEAGALVHDAATGRQSHVPAVPVPVVVDTTGAGDSFCGAFMAHWLAFRDPVAAARAGAGAAAVTVQGYGADPLLAADPEALREAIRAALA
jgi:sugar/nucleoside kinase (ribokinase family)